MANRINERFESTTGDGHDETWSLADTTSGGGTTDADYTVSSVTGAPDNWDDDCFESRALAGAENAYTADVNVLIPDNDICWFRAEVIWNEDNLANNQNQATVLLYGADGATFLAGTYQYQTTGGALRVRMIHWGSDSNNIDDSTTMTLDRPYVLEFMWDIDSVTEWVRTYIDGVPIHNEEITGGTASVTPIDTPIVGIVGGGSDAAGRIFIDNVIANNALSERVGTGRFHQGLQSLSTGVGTKALNKSHTQIDGMRAGLQAA